jgi:hypothetical protein
MREKIIYATKSSPEVSLNPEGIITIRGRSMMVEVNDFYKQFGGWLNEYLRKPAELTRVDFHLEYLKTNNLKFYIYLLARLKSVELKNKKYVINWYYEEGDEDILEKGQHISAVMEVEFNFIMISDPNIHTRQPLPT